MRILGIDEAGRGPVIGPLVIAGVMAEKGKLARIKELGAKDSKLLSPKQREELYSTLISQEFLKYEIKILEPADIDKAVTDESFNLNWLEAINSAIIINKLMPNAAILDSPSNNIKAYSDYVKKNLLVKCEIVAEHKADLNHPIVGAASILAKVTRDREIEKIKAEFMVDFGSGYPSDPKTVEFLRNNHSNPKYLAIFRKSWQSYKDAISAVGQRKLGEF